jgi:hypothetical protein
MRIALLLLLLSGVAFADPVAKTADANTFDPNVLASLERTVCFGTCPAYSVVVYTDGRVVWTGHRFVKVKGGATETLSASELEALKAAFAEANYFDLNGNYACRGYTDAPSAVTTFNDGKRQKRIAHYYGCRSAKGVDALTNLESKFDEIVKTSQWVGTPDERKEQRPR